MNQGILRVLLGAAGVLLSSAAATAQDARPFPSGAVRIIVPYPPGGQSDSLTRAIAQKLAEKWRVPVVVDNRAGANGIIGLEYTARATPDGNTLVVAEGATFTVNPSLYAQLPYDPIKDFAPITNLTAYGSLLVVNPSVPVNSVKEFIAYAKSKPGTLSYGSFGVGSGGHLNMEAFKLKEGLDLVHVPYKGSSPMQSDLLAGRLSAAFLSVSSARENVKAGKLKALGFAYHQRSPILPDVPTFEQLGISGYEATSWFCMMAPAGTPKPIIAKIHGDVVAVIKDPAFVEQWFTQRGTEVVGSTPEELTALIKSETPMWAKVIKDAGVKLD